MASAKSTSPTGAPAPFLAEFRPLRELWESDQPLFPGEQSARWWLRNHRPKLAEADAVAIHRRELFVHPQRVAAVMEREALAKFRSRADIHL
jgi:hypothetical protein